MTLIAVFSIAFLVRAIGVDFGSPAAQCRPDEELCLREALFLLAGDPHFHMHFYPPGLIYTQAAWLWILERLDLVDASLLAYAESSMAQHHAIRWISVISGSFAAAAIAWLLLGRFSGSLPAFCGGLALALAPLTVLNGHFGTVDTPGTAMFAMALAFALRRAAPARRDLLIAAAFSGFAAAFKYPHGAVALVPFAMALLGPRRVVDCVLVTVVACLSFLAGAPTFLLDFEAAFGGLRQTFSAQEFMADAWTYGPKWLFHLRVTLLHGFGFLAFPAAIIGFVTMPRAHRPLLLAVVPAGLLFTVHSFGVVFTRYLLPVHVVLAIGVGALTAAIERRFGRRSAAVVLALVLLPSAYRTYAVDRMLCRTDTRGELIAAFSDGRLPTTLPVIAPNFVVSPFPESWQPGRVAIFSSRAAPTPCSLRNEIGAKVAERLIERRTREWPPRVSLLSPINRDDVIGRLASKSFLVVVPRSFGTAFAWYLHTFESFDVDSLVTSGHATCLLRLDPRRGDSFPPIDAYDPLDYWYLPFPDVDLVERPGPVIEVWRFDRP